MRTCAEIRAESWRMLWKGGWFWRLFAVTLILGVIAGFATNFLSIVFQLLGINDLQSFFQSVKEAKAAGEPVPEPTAEVIVPCVVVTVFLFLVQLVFAACQQLGLQTVYLKASRDDGDGWFESGFVGFKHPLGAFALLFLTTLRTFLWSLLLLVPGVIAVFRYSFAFYLKADHLDWSASKCLAESSRLTDGRKMKIFVLVLSYWRWFVPLLVLLVLIGVTFAAAIGFFNAGVKPIGALLILAGIGMFMVFMVTGAIYNIHSLNGLAIFFRDVAAADRPAADAVPAESEA